MQYRFAAVSLAAALAVVPSVAAAEVTAADDSGSPAIVSDGELSGVRGGYIASSSPKLTTFATTATSSTERLVPQSGPSTQASPAGSLDAGSQITYFGLALQSQWTSGGSTQTAGVNLSDTIADPSHPVVQTWQVAGSTAAAVSNGGNSVTGSPLGGFAGGVGQSIQIAGNGNTVNNATGVVITSTGSPPSDAAPPAGATACSSCVTYADGGLSLHLGNPGNLVQQSVGPTGIVQSAIVTSDGNTVANALQLQIGVTHGAASASALSPSLMTGIGILK